jgi:hypothetical protein
MTIIPYSFTPGQKAKASEVNANFIALADKISENREYAAQNHAQLNNLIDNVRTSVEETGNIKAGLDLSNVDEEIDFVVESYVNGKQWYRKYRSGRVEQGGEAPTISNNGYSACTVNFNIPFADTNCFVSIMRTATTSNSTTMGCLGVGSLSKTGFNFWNNTAMLSGNTRWYAFGMGE